MFNLTNLYRGLVVSCQPEANEAFYTAEFVVGMAAAAQLGGATALRLNHPETIALVRQQNTLPVIGIWKQIHTDSDVYITPTLAAAEALLASGAEIIALDATSRKRPAETLTEIVNALKGRVRLMADISTVEEGLAAAELGFDCIGTTLSGYTSYSSQHPGPDYALLAALVQQITLPIILEGKVWSPEEARRALDLGAHAVVVGSAITRPQLITQRYCHAMLKERAQDLM